MTQLEKDLNLLDSQISAVNIRNLRRIDWILLGLAVFLGTAGLITLYSASHSGGSVSGHFSRQLIYLAGGLVAAAVIVCVDYRLLVSLGPVMYAVLLVSLVLVLVMGLTIRGGTRWLDLGPIHVQPSEFGKPVLIYMLAWYFGKIGARVRRFPFFVLAFVIAGTPAVMIVMQSDLGTAVTYVPIVFAMLLAAGCKRRHMLLVVLAGLSALPVGWMHLKDYQKDRVRTFVDPSRDPEGKGYQLIQTKIAVGSGQMWGKGVGKGTQTHLRFLPEYRTDFIFALFAEERGFVGVTVVIGLYLLFFLRGLGLAQDCPDIAGRLLAVGCVALLAFHAFVNIAITAHLMPITGLPLPFFSYGGSFLVTTLLSIGMVLSVNVRRGMFD